MHHSKHWLCLSPHRENLPPNKPALSTSASSFPEGSGFRMSAVHSAGLLELPPGSMGWEHPGLCQPSLAYRAEHADLSKGQSKGKAGFRILFITKRAADPAGVTSVPCPTWGEPDEYLTVGVFWKTFFSLENPLLKAILTVDLLREIKDRLKAT